MADTDEVITYAELDEEANRLSNLFRDIGLKPGDRIAFCLENNARFLVLCWGAHYAGLVYTAMSSRLTTDEMAYIIDNCGARVFITSPYKADQAAELRDQMPNVELRLSMGGAIDGYDSYEDAVANASPTPLEHRTAGMDMLYSSGTTADPKGARHSDASLCAAARGMSGVLDVASDDRVAMVFPFTHVGGIVWVFSGLMAGCSFIVVPVFDPSTSIDVLARHGVTQATAGTAFHQAYLAEHRKRLAAGNPDPLFPDVRSFPGGGAPKPPELHFEMKREMGGAGVISGYGMTECPILAMNSVHDPDDKLAYTEGRPCPSEVDLRVVRSDETLAGPGEEGEFRVKAPQLCQGYLDESLNAAAFDAEGYFRTGDLGYLDEDGFAVITGRLKDVIIRKGENISAKEVEDLLYTHAEVREVAVVGLPDPETGERACAVITLADASKPLSMATMVDFLKEKGLMVQKIPEQLEIVDEIPRNATGKILKQDLRKKFEHTKRGE